MLRMALFALTFAAAASVQAWPPALVASFPAPPGTWDVAFEGTDWGLYALADGTPPKVYKLHYTTGSIISSFSAPIPNGARGISYNTYPNDRMWISNRLNGYIYVLTTTGSLISSFPSPLGTPYGLGYAFEDFVHGYYRRVFYVSARDENAIGILGFSSGSLITSFAGPATAVVAFDDFFAGDLYTNDVYWDYYGSWQVFDTLPARPYGIGADAAWCMGGDLQWVDLFVVCANGYIYHYYGTSAVAPASLGRLKALYR